MSEFKMRMISEEKLNVYADQGYDHTFFEVGQQQRINAVRFQEDKSFVLFPLCKFPNVRNVFVGDGVERFYLDVLEGCEYLENLSFGFGYNKEITIYGDISNVNTDRFSCAAWFELLKYRPDLYSRIPSRYFGIKGFQQQSVDAVIDGMKARADTVPAYQLGEKMKEDKKELEKIRNLISYQKQQRKSKKEELIDMYSSYREDLKNL